MSIEKEDIENRGENSKSLSEYVAHHLQHGEKTTREIIQPLATIDANPKGKEKQATMSPDEKSKGRLLVAERAHDVGSVVWQEEPLFVLGLSSVDLHPALYATLFPSNGDHVKRLAVAEHFDAERQGTSERYKALPLCIEWLLLDCLLQELERQERAPADFFQCYQELGPEAPLSLVMANYERSPLPADEALWCKRFVSKLWPALPLRQVLQMLGVVQLNAVALRTSITHSVYGYAFYEVAQRAAVGCQGNVQAIYGMQAQCYLVATRPLVVDEEIVVQRDHRSLAELCIASAFEPRRVARERALGQPCRCSTCTAYRKRWPLLAEAAQRQVLCSEFKAQPVDSVAALSALEQEEQKAAAEILLPPSIEHHPWLRGTPQFVDWVRKHQSEMSIFRCIIEPFPRRQQLQETVDFVRANDQELAERLGASLSLETLQSAVHATEALFSASPDSARYFLMVPENAERLCLRYCKTLFEMNDVEYTVQKANQLPLCIGTLRSLQPVLEEALQFQGANADQVSTVSRTFSLRTAFYAFALGPATRACKMLRSSSISTLFNDYVNGPDTIQSRRDFWDSMQKLPGSRAMAQRCADAYLEFYQELVQCLSVQLKPITTTDKDSNDDDDDDDDDDLSLIPSTILLSERIIAPAVNTGIYLARAVAQKSSKKKVN